MKVYGYNSVSEALKAKKVNKIYVSKEGDLKIGMLISEAKSRGIPVYTVENLPGKIAADVSPINYKKVDEIIKKALENNGFILILDNVTDQRNLGACIRTAEFFGAAGVLIPKRRAAQVNEGAVKTSAGAVFHLDIAREENLVSAIKKLKKYGFYIVAADLDGERLEIVNFSFPLALVVGGEDKGISHHVKKRCDSIVRIPGSGRIESLNLSVAAGIIMYEIAKKLNR